MNRLLAETYFSATMDELNTLSIDIEQDYENERTYWKFEDGSILLVDSDNDRRIIKGE